MRVLFCAFAATITLACQSGRTDTAPSPEEAHQFIEAAEKRLEILGEKAARAAFVRNTHITVDTQAMAADAHSDYAAAVTEIATGARRFEGMPLPQDDARKLMLLKLQLSAP